MTTLHIFTEEPSAKIVFDKLLPLLLPNDVSFQVHRHQGKQDLENALRKTLPSISKIPGSKILITRDQDNEDCVDVKKKISEIIKGSCHCDFKIRVICKELEAWFLGDLEAVKLAYPRFNPEKHSSKSNLRNVDKISSPNKLLLKIIPEFSERDYLPKLQVSESISEHLSIYKNKSPSFNITIDAIKELINIE